MKVLLVDFVRGVTRWITQEAAERSMVEQERCGIQFSSGTVPPSGDSSQPKEPE